MKPKEIESKLVGAIQEEMNEGCFTAPRYEGGVAKSWAVIGGHGVTLVVRPHKKRGNRITVYSYNIGDHTYWSKEGKNLKKTAKKIIRAVTTNNGWLRGATKV